MDINQFAARRPYLYHLTDRRNFELIAAERMLKSTALISEEIAHPDAQTFLRTKRPEHVTLNNGKASYIIRDQKPISEVVLRRSLEEGCSYEDFLYLLNSRVFFWPTLNRLNRHFKRYAHEHPIIIRISTADLFKVNEQPLFCKYNSGATRCSSHWDGNAPERGHNTFLPAERYDLGIASIAEVTFELRCRLPETFYTGDTPDGPYQLHT